MLKVIRKSYKNKLKKNIKTSKPISIHKTVEKSRNRQEVRIVKVFNDLKGIDLTKWLGLQTIIQITRKTEFLKNNKKTLTETAYFISSLPVTTNAKVFNQGIRSHWSIENSLHYVKDKTFQEDHSKIVSGNAPVNMSLVRSIVLNVLRKHGYENIAQAIRLVSNDIFKMWDMLA